MKDQVDKYLAHLDKIFNREPVYTKISNSGEFPPFYAFTYRDIPEIGMTSGFTCGFSFVEPPDSSTVRNELLVSVNTDNENWVLALAHIAYRYRDKQKFNPGDTINFNAKVSKESDMSSFFVWHQGLVREDHEMICIGNWHIKLLQLFPIHDDERILILKHGPEWLMELVHDPSDVKRSSVAHKFKG